MSSRPTTLTLAALGGQGGGVVTDWLVDVAEREGYTVQATSVPGVAQRTGATIYYLEFFPKDASERAPVMALMPAPGLSDIVVASELVEATRMVQRGIVDPEQTTLITSTHRVYTIGEKSHLGDGRAAEAELVAAVSRSAKRLVTLDMAALATEHGSVVSAAILGAIAGANVLPFGIDSYRAAIRAGGKGVDASLATFAAACSAADSPQAARESVTPAAAAPLTAALTARIDEFPETVRGTVRLGTERLVDYQDEAYALEYLSRLKASVGDDPVGRLTESVARGLALWMSFEDTFRVAQLKIRPQRLLRLREEAALKDGELMRVSEFLKPRVEEVCGSMPAALGKAILDRAWLRNGLAVFTGGRRVKVTTISGFVLLRALAALRRTRRYSLRYADEHKAIQRWIDSLRRCATNYDLACEVAECQELVAGYGETHARGRKRFEAVLEAAEAWVDRDHSASALRSLRELALQDENDDEFNEALQKVA